MFLYEELTRILLPPWARLRQAIRKNIEKVPGNPELKQPRERAEIQGGLYQMEPKLFSQNMKK